MRCWSTYIHLRLRWKKNNGIKLATKTIINQYVWTLFDGILVFWLVKNPHFAWCFIPVWISMFSASTEILEILQNPWIHVRVNWYVKLSFCVSYVSYGWKKYPEKTIVFCFLGYTNPHEWIDKNMPQSHLWGSHTLRWIRTEKSWIFLQQTSSISPGLPNLVKLEFFLFTKLAINQQIPIKIYHFLA